jgi:ubiquitin-like domain-containing CTD phosphatase 1
MFKVNGQRRGKPYVHEVKALDIIYAKLPQFNPANTIHIDDLARNFVMNPGEGLRISAFKNGPENRHDTQLFLLEQYLRKIAVEEDDFTKV